MCVFVVVVVNVVVALTCYYSTGTLNTAVHESLFKEATQLAKRMSMEAHMKDRRDATATHNGKCYYLLFY